VGPREYDVEERRGVTDEWTQRNPNWVEGLFHSPRGAFWPLTQSVRGPGGGLIGMAGRAWIGNFVLFGGTGIDKGEGVSAHFDIGNGRLDFRHVARDALAAGRAIFVMRVLLQSCGSRPVQG
jgi:hypothetical protein